MQDRKEIKTSNREALQNQNIKRVNQNELLAIFMHLLACIRKIQSRKILSSLVGVKGNTVTVLIQLLQYEFSIRFYNSVGTKISY